MDNAPAVAAAASVAPPAGPPPVIQPSQPIAAVPATTFDAGGGVSPGAGVPGVKKPGFFSGITVLDVGVIGLVTFALLYNIYYIRQKIFYLRYSQQDTQAAAAS